MATIYAVCIYYSSKAFWQFVTAFDVWKSMLIKKTLRIALNKLQLKITRNIFAFSLITMEPHPAQLLIVPPEILRKHLIAFEREINSKRLQSKLKSIGDLIIVLYKRNVINRNNYANVLQNVSNDFPCVSDKAKIKDFVNLLDRQSNCSDINVNQYGEFEFICEE